MSTLTELRIRIPTFEEVEDDEFYIPDWPVYPEHMSTDDMDYIDSDYITQLIHVSEACRTLKRRALVAAAIFRYLYYHPNLLNIAPFRESVRVKVNEYRGLITQGSFSRPISSRIEYECDRVSLAMTWVGH
jgi:hypothetical protein